MKSKDNIFEKLYVELYNDPNRIDKITDYIINHYNEIDFNNKLHIIICDLVVEYLLSTKAGTFTEKESTFLIKYLPKKYIGVKYPDVLVNVVITDDNNYSKIDKYSNQEYLLAFNNKLKLLLCSNDFNDVFNAINIIFQESYRIVLFKYIYTKTIDENISIINYRLSIENIIKFIEPRIYKRLKDDLYTENKVKYIGLDNAIALLSNNKNIDKLIKEKGIEEEALEYNHKCEEMERVNYYIDDYSDELKYMESILSKYMKTSSFLLNRYPVLNLLYDKNGNRKSSVKLYREKVLHDESFGHNEEYDMLYSLLINCKVSSNKDINDEIKDLKEYANTNFITDEYLDNIIKTKEDLIKSGYSK